MNAFTHLETPLDEQPLFPAVGFAGALAAAASWCDAEAVCWGWPLNLKKAKWRPRKNWRSVPLIFRLLASIEFGEPEQCWIWKRRRSASGYGTISHQNVERVATHLVLEFEGMSRPSLGFDALHSCDNPACCNPGHLRWGTPKENSADMMARGRHNPAGIEIAHERHRNNPFCRSGRHLLSDFAVKGSGGKRFCGACHKERRHVRSS